jgi:hypothetical protein
MSVEVDLRELAEAVGRFGTVPMLLTTEPAGRPRVSAVSVTWDGTDALVRAGRRSVTNARTQPLVTLLWPAAPGEAHALIVDGETVSTDGESGTVRFRPVHAILHVVDRAG